MFELKPLIPGALGAGLAALMGPKREVKHRVIGFAVGFAFAVYLTVPVVDFFSLKADTYSGGVGFVLGFFGLTLSDAATRLINEINWEGLASLIKSKLGGGQ